MIGHLDVSRILAHTPQPSSTGSITSSSTRSGSFSLNSSTALPPSAAMRTSKPSLSRYILMRLEILLSSSTTRILRAMLVSSFTQACVFLLYYCLLYAKLCAFPEQFVKPSRVLCDRELVERRDETRGRAEAREQRAPICLHGGVSAEIGDAPAGAGLTRDAAGGLRRRKRRCAARRRCR